MNKWLLPALSLLVAVSVAEPPAYSQEAEQRCAFISEVAGKVVLQRNGKFYLVSGMEGVYCGESIRVLAGSKVVMAMCASNSKSEIPGPAEFTVTPQKPVFKSGKARNRSKIDPELCPFFMAEAFHTLKMYPEVDASGSIPPERMGTEIIYKPNAVYPFNGYLAVIKGDIYFAAPEVLRLTGDVVPDEGSQILARAGSVMAIYSCGEAKKYVVEGPALVSFNEPGKKPTVAFVRGRAVKVEELEIEACYAKREEIFNQENFKPVGLDGK